MLKDYRVEKKRRLRKYSVAANQAAEVSEDMVRRLYFISRKRLLHSTNLQSKQA